MSWDFRHLMCDSTALISSKQFEQTYCEFHFSIIYRTQEKNKLMMTFDFIAFWWGFFPMNYGVFFSSIYFRLNSPWTLKPKYFLFFARPISKRNAGYFETENERNPFVGDFIWSIYLKGICSKSENIRVFPVNKIQIIYSQLPRFLLIWAWTP